MTATRECDRAEKVFDDVGHGPGVRGRLVSDGGLVVRGSALVHYRAACRCPALATLRDGTALPALLEAHLPHERVALVLQRRHRRGTFVGHQSRRRPVGHVRRATADAATGRGR